jgi:hypothetical protein
MLTLIEDLPDGVVGVEAQGKVTAEDFPDYTVGATWEDVGDLDDARAWVSG